MILGDKAIKEYLAQGKGVICFGRLESERYS